jgi:hypothetical protein
MHLRKAGFAYFAAISFPDAKPDKLRTAIDWLSRACLSTAARLGHQTKLVLLL